MRILHLLWLATIAANLFVMTFVAYSVYESRLNLVKSAQTETENLATILDYSLTEKFRRLEFALMTAEREFERQLKQGGIQAEVLSNYLLRSQESLVELDGLRMTDADGLITYNRNTGSGPRISLADRDYFLHLKNHPGSGTFIGQAVKSRVTGRWILPVARRLNDLRGNFAGMVYATVWISELTQQFSQIDIGHQGVFFLRDTQFRLISRYPTSEKSELAIGTANTSPELREMIGQGQSYGSFYSARTVDGINRVYSYRRLPSAPLIVIAAKAEETYLKSWYALTYRYIGFALLFALVSLLALRVIRRSWLAQEQSTRELQETKDILETVTEESSDWVYWRSEEKNRIFYCSNSCQTLLGYTPEEIYARPALIDEMIHPDDRARWDKHAVGCDHHDSEEYRIITGHGDIRWISHSCRQVRGDDGGLLGRRGSNIDITDKKRIEEAHQRSQNLFSGIFHASPVGIAISDVHTGRLAEVNDAFEQLYGYARSELIGVTTTDLGLWMSVEERQQFVGAVVRGEHVRNRDFCLRHRDGTVLDILVSGELLTIGHDQYLLSVHQDITDRKRSEVALRAAVDAAEAANLAKSRFLAMMSHEIRTPMNGVLGMAQMLMLPGVDDSERVEFATVIHESGQLLLRLLNDILDHAKIEAGKLELSDEPFVPNQILNDMLALFGEVARKRQLTLQVIGEGVSQTCLGDRNRLRQILTNLVNNALKFTEQGGVQLSVTERLTAGGPRLLFQVRDTGIGISSEKQSALFKPFSQVDQSLTRRFDGTGLGLTICMQLVQLMGGEIGLDSQMGEGSTFWFEIPLREVPLAVPN